MAIRSPRPPLASLVASPAVPVADLRAIVDRYKRDGVDPGVLAAAVAELHAALAAETIAITITDTTPPPASSTDAGDV